MLKLLVKPLYWGEVAPRPWPGVGLMLSRGEGLQPLRVSYNLLPTTPANRIGGS